jgi:hypothetical protein
MHYTILIKGHLDPTWSPMLRDAEVTHRKDGTSLLAGDLPDQTALIALMTRLNDLSVTILLVTRLTPDEQQKSRDLT